MLVAVKNLRLLLPILIGAVLPFAWILRDGLGPDAVESTGLQALGRAFWTFYVGPLIVLGSIAWLVLIRAAERREGKAERRGASVDPEQGAAEHGR